MTVIHSYFSKFDLKHNNYGQFSALDIVLFGIIIMIALSIQVYSINLSQHERELAFESDLMLQAYSTLDVVLQTTLEYDGYRHDGGVDVENGRQTKPVAEILSENLLFRKNGNNIDNIDSNSVENKVKDIITGLSSPDFEFSFYVHLDGTSIFLTSQSQDYLKSSNKDHANAQRYYALVVDDSIYYVYFNLGLWRV
ncbi:MAG: hypothetical protein JSV49_07610 [Thermoplasmata archaeon]|nr:MAG: hypothetical protein JSV49_07610 [Thermoplasmata archaeon]